ncbi:MAG: ribosome silencing factor [Clostridia bacterium]|nr:ribosome silencing factor [Clostridia bacterium]
MDYIKLSEKIAIKLNELGAKKIEIYDVSKKTNLGKVFIFSSVVGTEIAKNITLELEDFLRQENVELEHIDGQIKGEWIILDFKDIIVHIFQNEIRVKYNLEKLWKDNKNLIKVDFKSE